MLKNVSEKSIALFITLIISISAIFIGWLVGKWFLVIALIITMLPIIYIARSIWIADKSNFLLRSAVLGAVSIIVLSNQSFAGGLIVNFIQIFMPKANFTSNELTPTLLLFLTIITAIVFYFTQAPTHIGKTKKPIEKLLEGPSIKQKWESVCNGLAAQIRDIDRDTNWSNEYYTPLEAEVEMKTSTGNKKVLKDLLDAIKQSDDRLFLLIGDPGSGKSVALRKLCLDLLKDSINKEYIPIYVNLKEWVTSNDWKKEPPTWRDLEDFVKESLSNKDRHLADFFENYYKVLDENGNLFFVLDSFDEIPQVLSTTADSKLIEDITKVCREFLVGAKQPRSRGIIASREYRMPRADYLDANTVLRIRPFTFEKIETTLVQNLKIEKEAVKQLFRDRRDLIPILRNPFITSLLQNYLSENAGKLPENQAELYSDYIKKSIVKTQSRLGLQNIPFTEIEDFAISIANFIFSESGLQAPLSLLRKQFQHPNFDEIIAILRYSGIARGNISGADIFSFAHRRFYEYFVVRELLKSKTPNLPVDSIPTDSKWRDTLVLYCEVAPFKQAQFIADYCWFKVIAMKNNIRDSKSKHCLRFLSEAFKGRRECLKNFHYELTEFILSQINKENDPIDTKIAVEALSILDQKSIDKGAVLAFSLWDSYIMDTTLRSCRHLDSISEDLEYQVLKIIDARFLPNYKLAIRSQSPFRRLIKMNEKELYFSLSLSEAFKDILLAAKWNNIERKNTLILFILLIPFMALLMYIITLTQAHESATEIQSEKYLLYLFLVYMFVILIYMIFSTHISKIYHFRKSIKIKKSIKILTKPTLHTLVAIASMLPWIIVAFVIVWITMAGFAYLAMYNSLDTVGTILFCLLILTVLLFSIHLNRIGLSFKKINKTKLNEREYIASVFNEFELTMHRHKLLSYLENNVKKVSGEYPENFLQLGNGEAMSRLIALEEKWREAEERDNLP